jgi:zinc-ribbon domain
MAACKNCGKTIPESWRYCPECGQDQFEVAPPPEPDRIETPTANVSPPLIQQQRESPAWLRGMGYTFGSCLLISLVGLISLIVFGFIVVSCLAVGSDTGGGY